MFNISAHSQCRKTLIEEKEPRKQADLFADVAQGDLPPPQRDTMAPARHDKPMTADLGGRIDLENHTAHIQGGTQVPVAASIAKGRLQMPAKDQAYKANQNPGLASTNARSQL